MDAHIELGPPVSAAVEGRVHGGEDSSQPRVFDREDSCKDLTPGTFIAGIIVNTEPVPTQQEENPDAFFAWCLFATGFVFPPCWVAAMCIGCPQNSNCSEKKAARWSFLSLLATVMLSISVYILLTTDFESRK